MRDAVVTMSVEEFHKAIKAQGRSMVDVVFRCPMCGTLQTAGDLIAAGAGDDFEKVEKYLAFSCVGRWTHRKPPPVKEKRGIQVGCNWTLGGLFAVCDLVVVAEDGSKHPRFMPVSREEAESHRAGGVSYVCLG